ncbi:MAG: hypothetical protein KGL58_04840 [Pseudomonadota bacterium]|nr:hypothetical protein [Pseudomonadota bacterium]
MMVPREDHQGISYVRVYDLPKHARGWFDHWLDKEGKPWFEDGETGERLAEAHDYDEWLNIMVTRYRNADLHALEPDRDE